MNAIRFMEYLAMWNELDANLWRKPCAAGPAAQGELEGSGSTGQGMPDRTFIQGQMKADVSTRPRVLRFGVFEADLHCGQLRKRGLKVKLHGQPFHMVTREEIREKLWPSDTFVDFEHSVNSAIRKIREALGDDSDTPRFIETLPKRGYRFIAPVVIVGESERRTKESTSSPKFWRPQSIATVASLLVLVLAAILAWNVTGVRDHLLRRGEGSQR
jgi:DNA-binding winged helix-turn-helix (wHTH) protein